MGMLRRPAFMGNHGVHRELEIVNDTKIVLT